MVRKETIGKIQLWIGIIVLLLGLTGIITSVVIFNQGIKTTNFPIITNETTDREIMWSYHMQEIDYATIFTQITMLANFAIGSLIVFIISLLFITQGLVNMGERQNVK